MPRVVRSRSADGATIAALLPPSSSSDRPNRAATRGPTSRPIRVDPVRRQQRDGRVLDQRQPDRGVAEHDLDDVGGEARLVERPRQQRAGRPARTAAPAPTASTRPVSPQTRAMAVFHDHTATGKLKAEMTPTTPSGCQVSISR